MEAENKKNMGGGKKVVYRHTSVTAPIFSNAILIVFLALAAVGGVFYFSYINTTSKFSYFVTYLFGANLFMIPAAFIALSGLLITLLFIYFIFFRKRFDKWIEEIAVRTLSSQVIYYNRKTLFVDYDINLTKKEALDFINKISQRSRKYTYYFNSIDVDNALVYIDVAKKHEVPKKATVDKKKDLNWNIVQLGEAVNHELRDVTPIGWWLNDENKDNSMVETIPSNSIIISGGTGSGKSVAQQCILGHFSRFEKNFMFIGVDCKRVEFNNFIGVKSVKQIALTVEDGALALDRAREIMMNRFAFMEKEKKNNVFKIDTNVDYYEVAGNSFQFDELFTVFAENVKDENEGSGPYGRKNDDAEPYKQTLLTIEEIYNEVQAGRKVFFDERYRKMFNHAPDDVHILKPEDITKTTGKFFPKAIVVMCDEMTELVSGDYKQTSVIQEAQGSIGRLGRAAAVHLVLAPLPEDMPVIVRRDIYDFNKTVYNHLMNLKNKVNGKYYELPEYYENRSNDEILDQISYLESLTVDDNYDRDNPYPGRTEVLWKDVNVGDMFGKDNAVIYIGEWSEEECYKLIFSNGEYIEASGSHLFSAKIFSGGKVINEEFEFSRNVREALNESDSKWVSVIDIVEAVKNGKDAFAEGERIVSFEKVGVKKVRCIQTTKGCYSTSTLRDGAIGEHFIISHNTQRPSGNVISAELKTNIKQYVLLGDFDSSQSNLLFDEDWSAYAKPEIKGRGFMQASNKVFEFQSYWTEPDKDFEYYDYYDVTGEKLIEKANEIFKKDKPKSKENSDDRFGSSRDRRDFEEDMFGGRERFSHSSAFDEERKRLEMRHYEDDEDIDDNDIDEENTSTDDISKDNDWLVISKKEKKDTDEEAQVEEKKPEEKKKIVINNIVIKEPKPKIRVKIK